MQHPGDNQRAGQVPFRAGRAEQRREPEACDNTGEPLAWMRRPGSAGSNTAADHLRLLRKAISALPPALRRRIMVTCDGAGASHELMKVRAKDQLHEQRSWTRH